MTTSTDALGRSAAVQSSPPQTRMDPMGEFLSALGKLGPEDYVNARRQSQGGGEVTREDPRLWNAYQGYLRTVPLPDSSGLRKEFLRQVVARESFLSDLKVDKPTPRDEATFRATRAINTLGQRENKKLTQEDAWMVPALAYPGLDFEPRSIEMMRGIPVPGSSKANLAELVGARSSAMPTPTKGPVSRNTMREPARPASVFDRALKAPVLARPQAVKAVQEDPVYVRSADKPAQSTQDARASLLASASKMPREVAALESRSKVATVDLIDTRAPREVRESYREFLSNHGVRDNIASQREFVSLLSLRSAYMERKGITGRFSAADERAFLADTALSRLRMREQTKQPLLPREGEAWMFDALADPNVSLSPADLRLLGGVKWTNLGLGDSLAELRSRKAREAQTHYAPQPGDPYAATLNVASVFNGGDVQRNAFTLAARAGGYSDEEISRAIPELGNQGMTLFSHKGKEGEKTILQLEDAELTTAGGQQFVTYDMSREASEILRDARFAGPGQSVADYRARAKNSWSGQLQELGDQLLAYTQTKAREFGLEDNPTTASLSHGLSDGIRELTTVTANLGQNAEMIAVTARRAIETRNLMYSVKGDAEMSRYFAAVRANEIAADERASKTYQAEEQGLVNNLLRGGVAGIPKMVTGLFPGAFLLYDSLKHTNTSFREFGKELAGDLVGAAAGPLASQLSGGLKNIAARTLPAALIENPRAARLMVEMADRSMSSVVGAASNVLTNTAPVALQQQLGNASPEDIKKHLTREAFVRNVCLGFAMSLLTPARSQSDLDVLARPSTKLEGPLYGVTQLDGETKYYAVAQVENKTGGKSHIEFIELNTTSPKVQEKLKKNEVTSVKQDQADALLIRSRAERLTPAQYERVRGAANIFGEKKIRLDAERAALMLKAAPEATPTVGASKGGSTPKVSIKQAEAPAVKTEAPVAPKSGPVEPGVPPERLAKAQEKMLEAEEVYFDSDADNYEATVNKALLNGITELGVAPGVRQKLEALEKHSAYEFRQMFLPRTEDITPLLRALTSKNPAVNAHIEELLGKVGVESFDFQEARVQLREIAEKGVPARSEGAALSDTGKRLQTLLAASPPTKAAPASSTTALAQGPMDLATYRSNGATQAKVRELLGGGANELELEVARLKAFHPEYANIPDADLLALRAYSSSLAKSNYEVTNGALRTQNTKELVRLSPLIESTSSAINQMNPVTGTIYRGVRSDRMPPEVLARYMPGQTVTERGFTSSSRSEAFASTFDNPDVVMVIQSRGKGRDIAKASRSVAEQEVLFPPGTNFRVLAREKNDKTGQTVIYLDQLP